jgi:hypothetical protein
MQRTVGAATYNDKKSKRLSIYKNRHTQPPLRDRHGPSKNIAASARQQSISCTFHFETLAGQALAAINFEFPYPLLRARGFQELPPKRTHGTHAGYCAAFQQIASKPAGAPVRHVKAIFKNRKIPFISTS